VTTTFKHVDSTPPAWFTALRRVDFGGKKLIGASFRGVSFFVEESERSGGRRIVVHEFPLRDKPFVEDLGKRGGKFSITGYVIGDEYLTQKLALQDALEGVAGPGALVHPYHGQLVAICDTYSVHETKSKGGMATFTIAFVEAPAQAPAPVAAVDAAGVVSASADAAATATDAQLAADYDATGLPSFALTSASNAIKTATARLGAELAPAIADTQELAALNGTLTLIAAQATALARSPATLLSQVRTAITNLVTTAKNAPGAAFDALVAAYGAALETPVIAMTTTRQREAANQTALAAGLRRVMAVEAARLAPTIPFVTIEDATAARDTIAGLLDEQAQIAGDTAYPALVDLRSQVLRAVPGSSVFARVVTVTRRQPVPSLVLAYRLYGSVDQEPDIVARNPSQPHPGFLFGDLKVLSSDG
jgi:prophage DNA circulation protein